MLYMTPRYHFEDGDDGASAKRRTGGSGLSPRAEHALRRDLERRVGQLERELGVVGSTARNVEPEFMPVRSPYDD